MPKKRKSEDDSQVPEKKELAPEATELVAPEAKEVVAPEAKERVDSESKESVASEKLNAAAPKGSPPETEWIPGEQLELIRIPAPTIWPATLALGLTGIAFGVVTHWILSVAGLFLFLLGAAGWIEDLRNDVLQ